MEINNGNKVLEDFIGNLEDEKLVGWSATCLDQTISYYLECNYSGIEESDLLDNTD
uniref:hypothetical protein n=1 Tax=Nemalion vermiculare TaxID=935621 RepID=UPI00257C4A0E|nr:hypothetical protein QU266_pgp126 [Nemalion vermiculare]WGV34478.1 hypothetical protein [Nemalion vermiculare]